MTRCVLFACATLLAAFVAMYTWAATEPPLFDDWEAKYD